MSPDRHQAAPHSPPTSPSRPSLLCGHIGAWRCCNWCTGPLHVQAITRGLEDVADVEPWTTTSNPGRSTLDRLVELSQEVDFAVFAFAQDDWTATDASQFKTGVATSVPSSSTVSMTRMLHAGRVLNDADQVPVA